MIRQVGFYATAMFIWAMGCSILLVAGCGTEDHTQFEKSAAIEAQRWLECIDAGEYEACWNMTSDIFKKAGLQSVWMVAMKEGRQPMGKTVSRRLKNARYKRSLPGGPNGRYVVINFQTEFSNQKDAVETVAAALGKDGQWEIAGYHIK